MVGYTGTAENSGIVNQINGALSNDSSVENTFQVIKNVSGQFWSSAFAQISSFTQGEGYMMYVISETAPSLSFNSAITIPEIIGCTDCTAENFNAWATSDDESCIYDSDGDGILDTEEVVGCQVLSACNYNLWATDSGECSYAQEGYDCDGNLLIYVGAEAHGGIVFYIDETGEHGLVAALEDITDGSNMGIWGTPEGFEWGCYGTSVATAYQNYAIGTGLENTEAIVSQNCQTENGGITAAQATLNYEAEGFTDWFLPSRYELEEMYNSIGNGGSEGNIGGFETSDYYYYWSSSEFSSSGARNVYFNSGYTIYFNKDGSLRVRAVRAF